MSNDTNQAEELLQEAKEQKRHTSDPKESSESSGNVDTVDAIKEALLTIEDGDTPENINIRDAHLKALLVGLEEANELDQIAASLASELESAPDINVDDATQSDVTRLLIRVGLKQGAQSYLDDALEARKQAALEQATDF